MDQLRVCRIGQNPEMGQNAEIWSTLNLPKVPPIAAGNQVGATVGHSRAADLFRADQG